MRASRLAPISAVAIVVFSAWTTGCEAPVETSSGDGAPQEDEPLGSSAEAISTSDVMSCADQWVSLQVPYCGGVNGGTDYICGGTCQRPAAAWDHFRSDCSGFVSWCWQIPSDPTTSGYMSDVGGANGWHTIALSDLAAGDALVCDGHMMLFSKMVSATQAEIYEESNCGKVAHKTVKSFTASGQTLKFQYDSRTYHAIRRNGILPPVRVDGYVDSATDVVTGWAADLDASAVPLSVDLYFGGGPGDGFGVSVTASDARPDVAAALGIDPNHGFSVATPLYYCDDADHPVYAFAHSVMDGTPVALKQSPATAHCAPPKAPEGLLRHVTSPAVLTAWGFDERKLLAWMTPADRALHDTSADWPDAPELGISADGKVWVVDGGRRRHVIDPTSLAAWGFDATKITAWGAAELASHPEGIDLPATPVLLQTLGDPAVYVLDSDPRHLGSPPDGAGGGADVGSGSSGAGEATASADGSSASSAGCSVASGLERAPGGGLLATSFVMIAALGARAGRRRRARRVGGFSPS